MRHTRLTINKVIEEAFKNCSSIHLFENTTKNFYNVHNLNPNSNANNSFYSYNVKIGQILNENYIAIWGKTKKYNWFHSQTTSKHILRLIRKCVELNKNYFILDVKNRVIVRNGVKIEIPKPYKRFEDKNKFTCPITLIDKKIGLITKCNHKFGINALKRWLKDNKTCPLCRADLSS